MLHIDQSTFYSVIAQHSSQAMSVKRKSQDNLARIVQDENAGDRSQLWQFKSQGNSAYKIMAAHSQKYLARQDYAAKDGQGTIQRDYQGLDNQKWKIEKRKENDYRIISKHSKFGLRAAFAICQIGQGGNTEIINLEGDIFKILVNGSCMSVNGASLKDGADVSGSLRWFEGKGHQKWIITEVENGYHKIEAVHSGKCLTVKDYLEDGYDDVVQEESGNGENQIWIIENTGNNTEGNHPCVSIKNSYNKKYLDIMWGSKSRGQNVILHEYTGKQNQQWIIKPFKKHSFL